MYTQQRTEISSSNSSSRRSLCSKKETHYFVLDTDGTGENWKHAGELLCNSCLKHTVVTMEYSSAVCCIPDKFWSHEYTIWSFKFVNGVIFWVAIKL